MSSPACILISLSNSSTGSPSLGLIDIERGRINTLRVPDPLPAEDPRGVAVTDAYVFVVTGRLRRRRPGHEFDQSSWLTVLDRRDLTLLERYQSQHIVDAHSLLAGDGHVDVVSTGTDSIVRLHLDGPRVTGERVIWRVDPDGPIADVHHLNGIARFHGDVIVSGFGKKRGATWGTADDGFIVNTRTGAPLLRGLRHPHAVYADDGALAFCESALGHVRVVGDEDRTALVGGYVRGLCRIGPSLYAGISRGRLISKSTGLLTNRGESGETRGHCGVVRIDAATMQVTGEWNLDVFADEVYDVLAVEDSDSWPVLDEIEWRDFAIRGLRSDYDDRDRVVAWLHEEVAARDKDIRWLHGESAARDETIRGLRDGIAERNKTITWLHEEVAERDKTIRWLHEEVAKRDETIRSLHRAVASPPPTVARWKWPFGRKRT